MQLIRSGSLNPFRNLAVEDVLLDTLPEGESCLFFWRSEDAVVIGRNQNPWRECDLQWMAEYGCVLARRVSGGGAVYQDRGNLNYALILPRALYRESEVVETLCGGLTSLGLPAAPLGRNGVGVAEKKISGTAFCYRRDRVLHHGTLLIDADLDRLRRALAAPELEIETHAVASIPASVANLVDLRDGLSREEVETALVEAFAARYGEVQSRACPEGNAVEEGECRMAGDAWRYDHTPRFTVGGGGATPQVTVNKGVIESATPEGLGAWIGKPFREWWDLSTT